MSIHTFELCISRMQRDHFYNSIEKLMQFSQYIKPNVKNARTIWKFWDIKNYPGLLCFFKEIKFEDSSTARFLNVEVNPRRLLGEHTYIGLMDLNRVDECVSKLNSFFNEFAFHSAIESFEEVFAKRIDYSFNYKFETQDTLIDYISLLKRGKIIAKYKENLIFNKSAGKKRSPKNQFCIENNSVEVCFYDKQSHLKNPNNSTRFKNRISEKDHIDAVGLLRMEIRCKYNKIRSLKQKHGYACFSDIFKAANEDMINLCNYYFPKIYGRGDFLKHDIALECIENHTCKNKVKERVKQLIYLTSKYRSYGEAYKKMKASGLTDAQIKKAVNVLDELGISPITIPHRWTYPSLPNPLKFIVSDFKS